MAQRSSIPATSILARVTVHAESQAQGVEVIRHGSHAAREFLGIRDEAVVVRGIATHAPAIIEDHVVIAEIFEAVVDDELGGLEEEGFRDVAAEGVPIVPLWMLLGISFHSHWN